MKKIGLHGSYYCRNFGDTLILSIVNNWIKEYSQKTIVDLPFVTSEKEALEILNSKLQKTNFHELDGLIFGPGGYFGEPPSGFVRKLLWSIRNYRRHISWNNKLFDYKIPYVIIGVGVGPISFNFLRKRIIKLFKKAKFISVRDKHSKQFLVDWGLPKEHIFVSPDVALTLEPKKLISKNNKQKVALHYPNSKLKTSDKLNDFVEFIKMINDKYSIYLLEDEEGQFSNGLDTNLKNILKSYNLDLPVIKYKSPNQMISNLNEIDKVITSKLHVGIVSYALGKGALSIPLHSKTSRFYEQIKREEFCIPLENITPQLLFEKFEKLSSSTITENPLFEDATNNKKLIFKFLNGL